MRSNKSRKQIFLDYLCINVLYYEVFLKPTSNIMLLLKDSISLLMILYIILNHYFISNRLTLPIYLKLSYTIIQYLLVTYKVPHLFFIYQLKS